MPNAMFAKGAGAGSLNVLERTHTGLDKVQRYGWTFKDSPGEQTYLPKEVLEVDKSYQRNVNEAKVLRISKEWSWIACNSICVARRSGRFYVIDGQHRVMAACRRSDIEKLPCLVFDTEDNVQEAKGFIDANVNRKPMTMQERFNALLKAENPVALKAQKYIRQTGRSVSRNADGSSFTPVAALMKCVENDEDALSEIWPLMIEVCEGNTFHNELLQGMFYIQTRAKDGYSLSAKPWRDRVKKVGYAGLIDAIQRAKAFYARGGDKVYADGLVQVINHRMKKNKFEVNWPSSHK